MSVTWILCERCGFPLFRCACGVSATGVEAVNPTAEKFSEEIRRVVSAGPHFVFKPFLPGNPLPPDDLNAAAIFMPGRPLAVAELRAWRLFGAEVAPLLERVLAAQGDAAEADLISLQHSLAELLRSPANISRST